MKFYTADLHLDHKNVIRLSKRPFSGVEDMQDTLVSNWINRVSNSDDVYILGDFCFNTKTFVEYIGRLNGTKHFISGNHDSDAIKQVIKLKESSSRKSIFSKCFFHNDIHKIKDGDTKVVLCHFPIYEWEGFHNGAIHLHGHAHGNIGRSFRSRAYDVGVDVDILNYEPKTLEEIILLNSEQEK